MTNKNYLEALAAGFIRNVPHVRECGMRMTRIDVGLAEVELPFRSEWLGDVERGVMHTGILTTLVDSASGAAVLSALPTYTPIATLDLRMDYLRPAMKDLLTTCRAECYRLTTHIAFVRASVWQQDAAAPVAVSQSAFMLSSSPMPQRARA